MPTSNDPLPTLNNTSILSLILTYLQTLKDNTVIKDHQKYASALTELQSSVNATDSPLSQFGTLPHILFTGILTLSQQHKQDSDSGFTKFLNLLKQKGFFNNVEEGTLEYAQRLQAARDKFSQSKSKSQQTQPPQQPTSEAKSQSEQLKVEGNSLLTQGLYKEAISKYSAAIEKYSLAPLGAVLYANRACAYINTQQYESALSDCMKAIEVDSKYMKAHYRKGQALAALSRNEEAESSFKKALELCSNDVAMRQTIEEQLQEVRMSLSNNDDRSMGGMGNIEQMLGSMMGGGQNFDFSSIMQNPAFMQMAQSIMGQMSGGENPFGGFGASANTNADGVEEKKTQNQSTPNIPNAAVLQNFLSSEEGKKFAEDPVLKPVIADLQKNGPNAIMKYMSNPNVMQRIQSVLPQLMKSMNNDNSS